MQIKSISQTLSRIRDQAPLVHNITNYVVMNNTANALLAVGASPIMAHAQEEVAELVDISSCLVINIGTLSRNWIDSMKIALGQATKSGKPVVLDPVGVGASAFRTRTVRELITQYSPTVVRGNASEIIAMLDPKAKTKGVDSLDKSYTALEAARKIANSYSCVVCVSGAVDYITDGNQTFTVANGSEMMSRVTGMGCTATAIIGACVGSVADASDLAQILKAAWGGLAIMGVAGDIAAEKSSGPGSMQLNFLDALYGLSERELERRFRSD